MSHELRTPLNAVIGFSEVIADEVFGRVTPSRYREYASDIRKSGRHLLALVNDVLDLARIEAGTMPSELGSVKVAGLVRGIVRAAKSDLADNGNTLVLSCPRTVGEMVTDEKKLRSVLTNLIGNAAKFTRDGRIEVDVGREESQGRSWVVVRVSDTGIGMETDRVEEMFGEFTQQDPSIAKQFGGAGLGLAISRRFCESLGGGISVDSAPGEGVTMTVRLPDMADAQEASEVGVVRQLRPTG
jgi:signal transduction histidine kinase